MSHARSQLFRECARNAGWGLLVVLVVAWALPATAQDFPTWYARGQLGGAEIHGSGGLQDASLNALWFGGRVGRAFGESGAVALDVGLGRGSSEGGFWTYTGGLELRAFARSRVSPYVRLEMGYMTDHAGPSFVGVLGGGLTVRLTESWALRAGAMSGGHASDGSGPVGAHVGVEIRW